MSQGGKLVLTGLAIIALGMLLTYIGCGGDVRFGFPILTCAEGRAG